MEVLPLLPPTVKFADLSEMLNTTQGTIDAITAYTEKFPKIKLWIDLSRTTNEINRQTVEEFLKEKGLSQKQVCLENSFYY